MNKADHDQLDNSDESRHALLEYRAILNNMSLGIAVTRNRTFLHCNERFSDMFGWLSDELSGQLIEIVCPSPEAYAELGSGNRLDTELIMKKRDGTLFWCRLLINAIDPNDHSKGIIFIMEDIAERKHAQEALLRVRDDLEIRVHGRTEELAIANTRLKTEIQERRLAEEQVRHLANHDALTGLPNRRLLEDRIEQAVMRAKRTKAQTAVLFIDLDCFKQINDNLGHRVGDLLLQAVAARLRSLLREIDTVARVGGDEFVLVLPDIQMEDAACETAQRILDALTQTYTIDGHELLVTSSIGISLYQNDEAEVKTLISRANIAMYRAKQMGRKNYQLFRADFFRP
jgi:diguanylate cyclase (GGDEF)-like protein/PAS domain S-box-containing protein